jgi:hypothetical protein
MSSRWWSASGAVVAASALTFMLWSLLNDRTGHETASPPTPTSSMPAAAPLTEETARSLAANITSADESRVRRALAISDDQQLEAGAVTQLAAISLTIDVASFRDAQDGTATAKAQIGGPAPATWILHLVLREGEWKISNTEEAP